ncbi:hypothetical protein [Nesterenkonia pannonica]|uniref:glycosyltransferase family 8 protein n=1 Tax=Nesterenkonia pannonica TaxID=1548602 RepID=UPI00216470B6|nr:glycosyltransferase [Nesterenkonia pannonica]
MNGLEKVVYHDIDALAVGDVGDLYDTELGDAPLAARDAVTRTVVSGFRTAWAYAKKMSGDPERANDYLHRVAKHLTYDFRSFNAGIMVLNLEKMRRDDFGHQYLPWVAAYGINDQQLLNCYAGNTRVELDPRWNSLPTQEPVADPLLIHWAGHRKPWKAGYVAWKGEWHEAEARLETRKSSTSAGLETIAA